MCHGRVNDRPRPRATGMGVTRPGRVAGTEISAMACFDCSRPHLCQVGNAAAQADAVSLSGSLCLPQLCQLPSLLVQLGQLGLEALIQALLQLLHPGQVRLHLHPCSQTLVSRTSSRSCVLVAVVL